MVQNEQAAAQIAAQKKAREEAAERLRKLEVNRMLQTQVHMNMQSNLFTVYHYILLVYLVLKE